MKLILEINLPDYIRGATRHLLDELGHNPDIITSAGNWVYRTDMDNSLKEKNVFNLISHTIDGRKSSVDTQQLKLFEA